jgi:putative hydrolase of the HAD superfamily
MGGDGAIRAVLFDVGGTLIDERDPNLWAEEAAAVGLPVDPEALEHWFEEVELENDRPSPRMDRSERWRRVLEKARETPVPDEALRAFLERIDRIDHPPYLFSDVRRCLDRLRRRRLTLGVLSNSRSEESLRALLKAAGIERYFSLVVSSGTEGVAKPDPEIFRRALRRLKLPPGQVLYVGNLAEVDARAARSAGLRSVWLNRGGFGFGTDPPEIISLSEVPLAVNSSMRSR